ncbi:GNAT family N-acetyltransferase [Roseibium aggregatum]|uniref:GNAT family N-acetyltransferase n=1 Tax=Roseibium aggregatum TaxID=187304 RepID=A0A939IY88_9HYPH|nr:GNAT family N-acetyltransferase [Roseibium aggregatum]MBN9668711.1 GNAT family N-acetyltransferase [Roseibium aggregatum]
MTDIPILTTGRLILRPMRMADWPDYLAFMRTDRSVGMGGPFELKMAWALFCHDMAQWPLMGHGALMLEDRKSGDCLGQVGINHGPLFPEHELGWFVYPHAEGKGLAFEAAERLVAWARELRQLPGLVSYVDRDNLRSRNLAERLGARLDDQAERPEPEDLVYRHF